jgi:glycosyltransferase involved in cell wall biosynthesis
MTIKEVLAQPKIFIYSKLYGFLYGINIKKNNHIIVQQSWLRAEFEQIYGLHNVVVAHPCGNRILHKTLHKSDEACKVFLYPAFPRVFKNFEILGDAAIVLREMGITGFEVRFTISGKENSYSRKLYKKYHKYDMIKFIGTKTKAEMDLEYINCHAVVFPSLLETWGLPITEAKSYNKKLIVSDLPYAHETVANYDSVSFFNPKDSLKLAYIILGEIQGKSLLGSVEHAAPIEPYMESWNDLIRYITKES